MNEEKKHQFYQFSVKAVLYKDKEIIVVKDEKAHSEEHKKFGGWNLPGGRLLKDEKIVDALNREIKEELGNIKFKVKGIIDSIEFVNPEGPVIALYYAVEFIEGDIKLSNEHKDFKWLPIKEIMDDKHASNWLKKVVGSLIKELESENVINNLKRAQADFENFRKLQEKKMAEFREYANLDLIYQILPVLDNFESSLEHIPEDQKDGGWVQGILYIKKQLENVLKNNGVEEIVIKEGDKFNPEIHEAVGNSDKRQETGDKISKVVQKGYKVGERVIRAARVIVS